MDQLEYIFIQENISTFNTSFAAVAVPGVQ